MPDRILVTGAAGTLGRAVVPRLLAGDGHLLREDPLAVIGRHWPDGPARLAAAGVVPWGPIDEYYDISRAVQVLDWRPRRGFTEYLDDLRSGVRPPAPRDGLPPQD